MQHVSLYSNGPVTLQNCGPQAKHSFFFDLIAPSWEDNKPLHRLCSLMRKMKAHAYTIESLIPNQETTEEELAAAKRCGGPVSTETHRLSFFQTYPKSKDWHDIPLKDFLGYAILLKQQLPDGQPRSFILESVAQAPTVFFTNPDGSVRAEPVGNYYVHCARKFDAIVGTEDDHKKYTVEGSFFCQQNNLTHVCAHACLRMAINSSPTLALPKKLTNKKINDLLGIDHTKTINPKTGLPRSVGNYQDDKCGGLPTARITEVIEKLGLAYHCINFAETSWLDYDAFVYPLTESRAPVILGITGQYAAHVVTVIGHTLNSDRWEPEARQSYGSYPREPNISSASWADHFIISDDGLGMYVTLPSDMIRNFLLPKYNPNLHAVMAVGIVPANVEHQGFMVEMVAAAQAKIIIGKSTPIATNKWLAYMRGPIVNGRPCLRNFVCRTILISHKNEYLDSIDSISDSNGNKVSGKEKQRLASSLPDQFWLTEITIPDLYTANKHKLGDVISEASSKNKKDLQEGKATIFAWLPGLSRWGKGLQGPQEAWSLTGHVPLMRHGREPISALEW